MGWTLAADGKMLVPDPHEQEARALIRRWRGDGMTYSAIGAGLLARGHVPRSGKPAWAASTLHHIATTDLDLVA